MQHGASASFLWPRDGQKQKQKTLQRRTLRPRSFPVVANETNVCFAEELTSALLVLSLDMIRKKLARNDTASASTDITISGFVHMQERVATSYSVGRGTLRGEKKSNHRGGRGIMHLNLPRKESCCCVVQRTAFLGLAPIFSSQVTSSVEGGAASTGRMR